MKRILPILLLSALLSSCREPVPNRNYVAIKPGEPSEEIIRDASRVVPSPRQLAWQELEFTMFAHFGMNTFTNREWGQGTEDPTLFNPTDFDANQWVEVARESGMKMIIVTAKHHDGFCMWPSKFTDHCVKSSPWMDGKGDVVGAVAKACHEGGLKFGVYLSPWDRHEKTYGTDQYNDYFVNQLTELLTNYGAVDEVWFDGACGEGPNGKRQVYDWLRYYNLIRKLQPQAVIAVMGPDVRWVGTESGYGRPTEWSVVPYSVSNTDQVAQASQQAPTDGVFIPAGDMMQQDLGSRAKIIQASALIWYPSEVDVSIRPGWFYHPDQDELVKSPEKLLDIWFSSVGRNSLLLLNVPPDTRGRINDHDIEALRGFKQVRDEIFRDNLSGTATVTSTSHAFGTRAANVLDRDPDRFWMAKPGDPAPVLTFDLGGDKTFDCLEIAENIRYGQRIEQFSLEAWKDGHWREVTRATTIGYSRFLRFDPVTSNQVRIRIIQTRNTPSLRFVALHKRLPNLTITPGSGVFLDSLKVVMASDSDSDRIHYTLDGSVPGKDSPEYRGPILLDRSANLQAIAFDQRGVGSFVRRADFTKSRFAIRYSVEPSSKYVPKTPIVLLDGRKSDPDYSNGEWLGWEGTDMTATIDLGEMMDLKGLSADFLNSPGSWIFLPKAVTFEYSADGRSFSMAGRVTNEVPWDKNNEARKEYSVSKSFKARYLRVTANSLKTCPPSHAGAGSPCWMFIDEIGLLR